MKKQDERQQKRPMRRSEKRSEKRAGRRQLKRQAKSRVGADQYEKGAREALGGSAQLLRQIADSFVEWAAQAAMEMVRRLNAGGKIMCCGNGGSAADAQHIAAELSGKFYLNRRALPAVSITTNPSSVTAISNDYGYEHVFSKQIEGLGRRGDVLLAFSTSGGSPNVLRAASLARKMGIFVIGFTGAGGVAFARKCDMCLVVPSLDCPRIQEAHIAVGHSICFLVERAIFGGK